MRNSKEMQSWNQNKHILRTNQSKISVKLSPEEKAAMASSL